MRKKTSVAGWLSEAAARLASVSDTASIEVQVVLASMLGVDRSWLLAHPEHSVEEDTRGAADEGLARLLQGEPLAYITGRQAFFGADFSVSPAVLIPRPETELLVETGLDWLNQHRGRMAVDVGCGSGIIGISLARRHPDLRVLAVDRSRAALEVARVNAAEQQVLDQFLWLQGDLLGGACGPFDLVCANLPYIPTSELSRLDVSGYEPVMALDGGPQGLDPIARLLGDSPRWLAPGGCLLLEIEYRQGPEAARLASGAWPGARITTQRDLAGLDRLLVVETGGSE